MQSRRGFLKASFALLASRATPLAALAQLAEPAETASAVAVRATNPPHRQFLECAHETSLALRRYKNAIRKSDPWKAAENLNEFFDLHPSTRLEPDVPPLAQLAEDDAYLRWIAEETALGEKFSGPEDLQRHVRWLLRHPVCKHMLDPEWHSATLKNIQIGFARNTKLFRRFDWEKFFRSRDNFSEAAFQFNRNLGSIAPPEMRTAWVRLKNLASMEYRRSVAESDAQAIMRRFIARLIKRERPILPPVTMQVEPALRAEISCSYVHYALRVPAGNPADEMATLERIRSDLLQSHGAHIVQPDIAFDDAQKRPTLFVSVDGSPDEGDALICRLDRLCNKTRAHELLAAHLP